MFEDAKALAIFAHASQKYGDEPYINHPLRVADQFEDDFMKTVAVLHDVVEDTKIRIGQIRQKFGVDVEIIVLLLSRNKKTESYEEFIDTIKLNPQATKIKIADIQDHLAHKNHNLHTNTPKALRVYRYLYHNVYLRLHKMGSFSFHPLIVS